MKYIVILLVLFFSSSCRDSTSNTKQEINVEDYSIPCVSNLDSLSIEMNNATSLKYGKIINENYSGMTLVDYDAKYYYYKGATRVWKKPDLDSIPQLIFNYKTCKIESLKIIKTKPYRNQ